MRKGGGRLKRNTKNVMKTHGCQGIGLEERNEQLEMGLSSPEVVPGAPRAPPTPRELLQCLGIVCHSVLGIAGIGPAAPEPATGRSSQNCLSLGLPWFLQAFDVCIKCSLVWE